MTLSALGSIASILGLLVSVLKEEEEAWHKDDTRP